jgi:2-haloacid dehalogenase
MTLPIKAIIFDFGGVLLEWNPRHLYRRFFPDQPEAMEEFLAEINFAEWNAQQDKGRPFEQAVAELSAQFPHHRELIKAYHEYWEESIVGPISGTVAIATRLKEKGYSLYGLSNWSAETYPIVKGKYDFFDLFDEIILSGEVGLIKPDPGIFRLMLERIQRPASECLFIDDSLANIRQAEELGYQVIHFQTPERLEDSLRDLNIL